MSYELGLESNQLKNFSVSIDGLTLTNSQVVSIQMKWNIEGFKIIGALVFQDLANMVENMPIRGNNEIIMAMTDFEDIVSKQTFRVTHVGYTKTQSGQPAVKLTFVDSITMGAMQLYNPASWESATMVDILEHDDTLGPLLVDKEKDFGSSLPKHKNFVMPLHVSFNVTMHWLAKKSNVLLFQTREGFVIQTIKTLFSREAVGDKFRYKTPNQLYRRKVYQFSTEFGKMVEANAFQATAKVASFDSSSKAPKYTEENFKDATEKLGSTGTVDSDLPATGERIFYKSDTNITEAAEFMWGKNAYKDSVLIVLVPGQFGTNIGDVVEVDFVNTTKPDEEEANINGLWLVTEIVDNILPPDFVQRVTLSRAKFSK